MKKKWLIKDLIDLEYFLHNDENNNDESVHLRDREIYLNQINFRLTGPSLNRLKKDLPKNLSGELKALKDQNYTGKKEFADALRKLIPTDQADKYEPLILKHARPERPVIIREWLERRRQTERNSADMEKILPGDAFTGIYKLLLFFLVITGAVTGTGLAFSFLLYKGPEPEPVNVSGYIGVLVLAQIILIFILMTASGLRRLNLSIIQPLHLIFSGFLAKMFLMIKEKLPAAHRNNMQMITALIKGKRKIYGSVFYWPIFIMAQVLGIGFNLGVLSGTMIRVLGSDLAFGWESTVQWSSQAVYNIVRTMAVPWSWFVPSPIAHPTLDQIEGSRIILKDGIYGLATPDLVSWWPFLCLAVLFYGLLPRIILFAGGGIAQNKALQGLSFNHVSCDRLIRRMTTRSVITEGEHESADAGSVRDVPESSEASDPDDLSDIRLTKENGLIALIPEDIAEHCSDQSLRDVIYKTFGSEIRKKIAIIGDIDEDRDVLDSAARSEETEDPATILLIQEAWQPPIKEALSFIQELRHIFGPESKVFVCLIGKPGPDTIFTRAQERDGQMWETAIRKTGDLYIGTEKLEADDGKQ